MDRDMYLLEQHWRDMEPVYDEAEQHERAVKAQIEAYEDEQKELAETDAWLRSLEPTEAQISATYEALLKEVE